MTEEPGIDFQLHVASRDPIAGDLRRDGGDWEPFVGWIGLANVLAQTLEGADGPPSDGPAPGHPGT